VAAAVSSTFVTLVKLAALTRLHSTGSLDQVGLADDVVPVKDCKSFVTANLHGDPLRCVIPHHASDSKAPQVMKEQSAPVPESF
jgi:hypothetical protein